MSCAVCTSPKRIEIEAAARSRGVRALAALYPFSKSSLHRHLTLCVTDAPDDAPLSANDDLDQLILDTREILREAKKKSDTRTSATLIAVLRDLQIQRAARAKSAPKEPVAIHVSYDREGHLSSSLSPAARQRYLGQLCAPSWISRKCLRLSWPTAR